MRTSTKALHDFLFSVGWAFMGQGNSTFHYSCACDELAFATTHLYTRSINGRVMFTYNEDN